VKLHEKLPIFKDYTPTHDLESLLDDQAAILRKVQLSYCGEEVHPAKEMTWEQLQPAMPAKGKAGQVRLLDLCGENVLADVVRDPTMLLKPEEEWPTAEEMRGQDKRNWCSDEEWTKICCGCSEAGVFEFLRPDQLLTIAGVPVLHNCMGVGKNKYLPDGREVLRMVMNVDVTNQILRILLADIRSRPYPGQWNAVSVEADDIVLIHSGTDLTCAYFAFLLEHTWWKFLAFNGKLTGDDVKSCRPDLADEPELYACCKCLAMGRNSASGLMQMAHNRMAMAPRPAGCRLPIKQQLRTDKPVPKLEPGISDLLWEIFQDKFEATEVSTIAEAMELIGTSSPQVVDMIEVYAAWGACEAEKKTFHRQLKCESLGFVKDGLNLAHYGTPNSIFILICLTTNMMTMNYVDVKMLQIVAGRWSRQLQLRRELAQLLDVTWRALRSVYTRRGTKAATIKITMELRNEWMCLMCAIPMLVLDYSKRTDSMVTVSDASEEGCGVCKSTEVTAAGKGFTRYVTMKDDDELGSDLMVFEIFGGLGGLRQCMALQGITPGVHVTSETHSPAARACLCQWPRTVHWGDVEEIDEAKIRSLVSISALVKWIIVGGGFSCHDFSNLKFEGEGHVGDLRFMQIARIAKLLKLAFPNASVKRFYGCVASMSDQEAMCLTKENNDEELEPVKLFEMDNRDIVRNHRRRYLWLDADLDSEPSENHVYHPTPAMQPDHACYDPRVLSKTKIVLLCNWPENSTWLDDGTRMVDDSEDAALYTFTRWIPRKKPPNVPAGLDQCDDQARLRWREDAFAFPPYQHVMENMIVRLDTNGVEVYEPPSVHVREKLLMYPPGITVEMLPVKHRKNERRYQELRLGAVGNGFPCGPLAWLLNRALIGWQYPVPLLRVQEMGNAYFNQALPTADKYRHERPSREADLVEMLMRYQTHVGGQIRCRPGREFFGMVWPRASVEANWWKWRTVISFPWDFSESINLLEAPALLNALRWRAHGTNFVNSRFIHLLDSQVVLGALNRSRSPSLNLNRVICRINAHILAASAKAIYAYVPTDANPADVPSRRFTYQPWRNVRK